MKENGKPITNSASIPATASSISSTNKKTYIFFFTFPLPLGAKPFPGLRPRQGRQNSICSSLTLLFRKFRSFSASCPDLFLLVTFSKTHRRTQRIHSWITLHLRMVEKLVRSETNLQILRNLHFCEPFTPIFD